jgi:hypothetical protein
MKREKYRELRKHSLKNQNFAMIFNFVFKDVKNINKIINKHEITSKTR